MLSAQYGNRGCDAKRQEKVPVVEQSTYLIRCLKPSVKETSRRRVFLGDWVICELWSCELQL